MTRFEYPPRVYALACIFAFMTLAFALTRLSEARTYEDPYPFRTQFARLSAVRPLIAKERAIGYISNLKRGEDRFEHLYFPTQYVLAPTLLVPVTDENPFELVLGNFTRQEDYAAIGALLGLRVIEEFPMGVVLYRRTNEGQTRQSTPEGVAQ